MMTLESQVSMYLEYVQANTEPITHRNYGDRIRRFTTFVKGRRVTREVVLAWYNSMLNESISKTHVMLVRAAVRRMYNWLVENEIVATNPILPLRAGPVVRVERPVITFDEHQRILVAADDHEDDDIWPYAVRCAWDTGLRISDVAGLKWEGVSFQEHGIRTIPRKTKRFNKAVEIPLSDEFLLFLEKMFLAQGRPSSGHVSPRMHMFYEARDNHLSDVFTSRICRDAGVVGKSFHSYRHAYCSRMLAAGVPAEVLVTCTGQTIEQLMQYVHLDLTAKRKIMFGDGNDSPFRKALNAG